MEYGVGSVETHRGNLMSEAVEKFLEEHGGNKKALADALGISRVTVWKKLKELEGEDQGQD